MSQLLVSFGTGTSGRFISTISYMLENNLNKEVKWTDNNSAHDVDIDYVIDVFTNVHFIGKQSYFIKYTHKYPNFDFIKNKIPNCKIIIIAFTKDNITELVLNHFLKNHDNGSTSFSNMSEQSFREITQFRENPFAFMQETMAPIPEQYKQDTLVIMYDEIYKEENNSFVVLEKLSKFLNKPINEFILKSYKDYVAGRNRILQENKQYIDIYNQMLQENNIAKI